MPVSAPGAVGPAVAVTEVRKPPRGRTVPCFAGADKVGDRCCPTPEVTPATISQLPTGHTIDVKLTKDGFDRATEQLLLTDTEPKGTLTVTLGRHVDAVVDAATSGTVSPPSAEPHHSSSKGAPVAAPAPSPPAVGSGKLNVGASGGWCNVTVDGTARGATPVAGLDVSAGPHRLGCTAPDGKAQAATVTVAADGTTRYRFTIGQ